MWLGGRTITLQNQKPAQVGGDSHQNPHPAGMCETFFFFAVEGGGIELGAALIPLLCTQAA